MKRILVWLAGTATALVLLFGYRTSLSGPMTTATTAQPTRAPSSGSGKVTGPAVDTRWGPVQVEITLDSGKITAVTVPRYPDGNRRDQQINDRALPILVRETLDAQSADIDTVSGATVTSEGYLRSLQAALDQAGK
ncbi:FMN-binding protein [Lentzea sp. NPDC004782]|uniref:FMN-binding protein n=1 Tax=Lentzea sp. NPDC004782 TaxID=3154458 RepID=UPI0033AF1D67